MGQSRFVAALTADSAQLDSVLVMRDSVLVMRDVTITWAVPTHTIPQTTGL
jgi:hypothetical protein